MPSGGVKLFLGLHKILSAITIGIYIILWDITGWRVKGFDPRLLFVKMDRMGSMNKKLDGLVLEIS